MLRRSVKITDRAPRYAIAVLAVLVALLLKFSLDPLLEVESPFLLFFSAILMSAWIGGFGPGAFATLLTTLISNYFFLTPIYNLFDHSAGQNVRLLIFAAEGLMVSGICEVLHRARRQIEGLLITEHAARVEAEHAMQVRERFVSIAAHDLKNPLTVLVGTTQLLQRRLNRDPATSPQNTRTVQIVLEQAERLHQLINALFDVSRLRSGQLVLAALPINLCALAQRIVDEIQVVLEPHRVELVYPDVPLVVRGDALRIEQVIQNLLQNAIKYSPDGGLISVRIEQRNAQACIAVRDQGIGIPIAAQERLFDLFYRADSAVAMPVSGMGIGLFVVDEIVRLHGGTVDVESREAQGSTFTVCLPLLANTAHESLQLQAAAS